MMSALCWESFSRHGAVLTAHHTPPYHSATLGGLLFDAAEQRALPLSRASLDRYVGMHVNGATFSHVARAVKLVPGKSVRKRLTRRA